MTPILIPARKFIALLVVLLFMSSCTNASSSNWDYLSAASGTDEVSLAPVAGQISNWVYPNEMASATIQVDITGEQAEPSPTEPGIKVEIVSNDDISNDNNEENQSVLFAKDSWVVPTAVSTTAVSSPTAQPTENMVFAHYMTWFRTPTQTGRWLHWGWDPDGDGGLDPEDRLPYVLREDGLPDLATAHQPLIGPYDSSDTAVIQYHIASAWAAGINGFIVDWYGPDDVEGIDRATQNLATQIEQWRQQYDLSFYVALTYEEQILSKEEQSNRLSVFIEHITYLLDEYAVQDGYLTHNGVPVVFMFEAWHDGRPGLLTPEEITEAKAQLPPFYLIYMGAEAEYLPVVDGFFTWIGGTNEDRDDWGSDYSNWLFPEQDHQSEVHDLALTVGSVWAGFDDTKVGAWDANHQTPARVIDRHEGLVYTETWLRALEDKNNHERTGPAWVQIVTWNDWNEGSQIEPSLEYGRYYLEQSQLFTAQYTGQSLSPSALIIPQAIFELKQQHPDDETIEATIDTAYTLFFNAVFDQALEKLAQAGATIE